MSTDQHFRQWIERELVPRLVKGGTLTPQPIVAVKSTEIRLQSPNEVFSLTYCYFVDIGVAVRDAAAADSVQIFSVVVKVLVTMDNTIQYNVRTNRIQALCATVFSTRRSRVCSEFNSAEWRITSIE